MRDFKDLKIAVAGIGYVGLPLAAILAQSHDVAAVDIVPEKARIVNERKSPIKEGQLERYLAQKPLRLHATTDETEGYAGIDLAVIAVPTDYDPDTGAFDTSAVDSAIQSVMAHSPDAAIVIRSTVPVGYTESAKARFQHEAILFSPEFLREGKALHDSLYPSRIIIGSSHGTKHAAETFAALMKEGTLDRDVPVMQMGCAEAEAVKLFANTYLALRVSFFNELDTYAESKGLDTERIISGVCADPRIGGHYNNPSFGYGGYCLPKDTKQLLANYQGVPEDLVRAIVASNGTRKDFIAGRAMDLAGWDRNGWFAAGPVTIGCYRLVTKSGSDNFRDSSMIGVLERILAAGCHAVVYEPMLEEGSEFMGCRVVGDFGEFASQSTLIIANRYDAQLDSVMHKTYTRDIFRKD